MSVSQAEDTGVLAISNLPNLKFLDLAGCSELTNLGLSGIGNLRQLKTLNLMWCNFTEKGMPSRKL